MRDGRSLFEARPSVDDTTEDGAVQSPTKPHAEADQAVPDVADPSHRAIAPERDDDIVDGDAATTLKPSSSAVQQRRNPRLEPKGCPSSSWVSIFACRAR